MNKVLLIGENNHTLLGLVRSFGANGFKSYGIIIGYMGYVSKSKYWKKIWNVSTSEKAIELLNDLFINETDKPVVLSSTDSITMLIDKNYEKLSQRYILSSINHKQNRITELMNKENQQDLFMKLNLNLLPTNTVKVDSSCQCIKYPVILKPPVSALGQKSDIRICNNTFDFQKAMKEYKVKGYSTVLVQQYLTNKKEYVIVGSVSGDLISFSVLRNIRQWPLERGTGCYSKLINDKRILNYAESLLRKISDYGYDGPIDIEFFIADNGRLYPNEINWRSSGRSFISLYTGVYSSVYWYMNKVGIKMNHQELISYKQGTVITETADIRAAYAQRLPIYKWVHQLLNSSAYSLWFVHDKKPVLTRFFDIICRKEAHNDKKGFAIKM